MGNIRTTEVQAIVNIDGEKVDFIRLKIAQEMGQHHDFEVLVDYKTFNETFHESPDKFLKKTNTKVVIDLLHADQPGNAYVFSGMVENMRMISEEGAHGAILFMGKSNTIELERGNMMQTFSNTNMQTILKEITGGTMNLSTKISPEWKSDIDFTMQYQESDWVFLQRLCNQFQEKYYYTGTDLVIGKHPEFPTVNLTYDLELRKFEVCSRLLPNQFSTYYYKRDEHKILEQDSPGSIDGANNLLNIVSGRSDNLTNSRKPNVPTDAFIPDMGSLIEHTKRRKVATGGRMMYVRGESKTCDVRIGRLVSIALPKNLGGTDVGTYRVYSIVHEFDQIGHYKCLFEAIPSDLEYIPTPNIHIPTPNLIQAEVWDNEDPEGMGRIKVQFPFDERPCETWITVMTPDAGGNGHGLGFPSRGYSYIPEISDTVAISFLDGSQLCHPVVVGSMFHGENAVNLGGGIGNHIKTITDKTGGQILMNTNKQEEWSIKIHDINGNVVLLDTKGKNIVITAPESMTLNSKYMYINVEETMRINAKNSKTSIGENMDVVVNKAFSQESETAEEHVKKNKTTLVDNNMEQFSGKLEVQTKKGDIEISSAKKALFKGKKDVQVSKG